MTMEGGNLLPVSSVFAPSVLVLKNSCRRWFILFDAGGFCDICHMYGRTRMWDWLCEMGLHVHFIDQIVELSVSVFENLCISYSVSALFRRTPDIS